MAPNVVNEIFIKTPMLEDSLVVYGGTLDKTVGAGAGSVKGGH